MISIDHVGSGETERDSLLRFGSFIADRWLDGFSHEYAVTSSQAWDAWRRQNKGQSSPWSCDSLSQAAARWSWKEKPGSGTFGELARQLQETIRANDSVKAAAACYQIFDWGDVAKRAADPSRIWVASRAADGTLVADLRAAVALLSPESDGSLARFHRHDLLMTSATTKLFAGADCTSRVVINDGRVGAALGLLARMFLEQEDAEHVPELLAFRWGAPQSPRQAKARTRDPSDSRYRFRSLPTGEYSHRPRAALSLRTNKLFALVSSVLAHRKILATPTELERAMFMIGYRVR
jgi:hypothetical protein